MVIDMFAETDCEARSVNILTTRAMQLTGASKQTFNEVVADGYYPAAPMGEDGRSRRFGDADVLGLATFAMLMKMGMKARLAGTWASLVVNQFRVHGEKLVKVHLIKPTDGEIYAQPDFGQGMEAAPERALEMTIPVETIMADLYRRYRELHQAGEFQDDAE